MTFKLTSQRKPVPRGLCWQCSRELCSSSSEPPEPQGWRDPTLCPTQPSPFTQEDSPLSSLPETPQWHECLHVRVHLAPSGSISSPCPPCSLMRALPHPFLCPLLRTLFLHLCLLTLSYPSDWTLVVILIQGVLPGSQPLSTPNASAKSFLTACCWSSKHTLIPRCHHGLFKCPSPLCTASSVPFPAPGVESILYKPSFLRCQARRTELPCTQSQQHPLIHSYIHLSQSTCSTLGPSKVLGTPGRAKQVPEATVQ